MRWTQQQYNEYEQRRKARAKGVGATPILERDPSDELLAKAQIQEAASSRVLVRITSVRKRLLDEDNLCEKFHVDCLRYFGVIRDDSAKTTKIETRQRKTEAGEPEHTLIEVETLACQILATNAEHSP